MTVNSVHLIGNLGQNPEIRYTPSGVAVAKCSLATQDGTKEKKKTNWHRLVFFGKLAEIVGEYCEKGKQIYIEGRIEYGEYTDKEDVKRYTTDIICDRMQMLGGKSDKPQRTNNAPAEYNTDSIPDEDIPF